LRYGISSAGDIAPIALLILLSSVTVAIASHLLPKARAAIIRIKDAIIKLSAIQCVAIKSP